MPPVIGDTEISRPNERPGHTPRSAPIHQRLTRESAAFRTQCYLRTTSSGRG